MANLLIAVQALHWGWGYYQLLLIYWFEALIIGAYNVLRMAVVGLFGDQPFGARLSRSVSVAFGSRLLMTMLGIGFFVAKFGGFALATGFWLLMLPAHLDTAGDSPADSVLRGLEEVGSGVGVAIGALVASHGVSFIWNFLWKREFATQSVAGLVFWPYLRMALVLIVVVGGLIYVKLNPGFGSATVMVGSIVLLKTVVDALTHLWEHRSLASRPPQPRAGQVQTV